MASKRKTGRDVQHTALAFGLSRDEWRAVRDAAADAHMRPTEYCRLMVLAAAGMGGVAEHLERAFSASFDVDARPGIKVLVERSSKQKRGRKP